MSINTQISSSFPIPGTFVSIQGTGTESTNPYIVLLMAETSQNSDGSGATFSVTSSEFSTFVPLTVGINNGGTGYKANDVLSINNVGSITVSTVDKNGAITAVTSTLNTTPIMSDMGAKGVSASGGSGSGATFDITSKVNNNYQVTGITLSASGSNYKVSDTFAVSSAGTVKVASVDSKGAILTISTTLSEEVFSTDPAGNNITPTEIGTNNGPVNQAVYCSSLADVKNTFGSDSDMARAFERYRTQDTVSTIYCMATNSSNQGDITAALAGLGSLPVSLFVSPFSSSGAIKAFDTFLDERWTYNVGLYGIHVTARSDTVSNLIAYGQTVNSKYTTVVAFPVGSDDDVVKSAAVGSVIAPSLSSDPSLPLQLMKLNVAGVGVDNAFMQSDRIALFNAGLAITREEFSGDVIFERSRTTYQTDASGTADDTYEDTETLPTVANITELTVSRLNTVFFQNRMKLAADSDRSISGRNIATPSAIKAELVSLYGDLITDGYCQDQDTFNANVKVSIKSKGVVSVYYPITLVGQLRQIDVNLAFSF